MPEKEGWSRELGNLMFTYIINSIYLFSIQNLFVVQVIKHWTSVSFNV